MAPDQPEGFINPDDPLHQAFDALTLEQKLAMARIAAAKLAEQSPETEEDGVRAEALRRGRVRQATKRGKGEPLLHCATPLLCQPAGATDSDKHQGVEQGSQASPPL